ncbi:hypothetical protein O181_030146 [Austropuccinia psidii MF-1]|uniref:Uncharacterized protein n=1 Tax=Austropuccinia psidii MF-1 TaxID=1389203 RepID=A0A9Q3CXW3_9BASI|nr:hypothetical protein [Austropuccinia psidii MF-1]
MDFSFPNLLLIGGDRVGPRLKSELLSLSSQILSGNAFLHHFLLIGGDEAIFKMSVSTHEIKADAADNPKALSMDEVFAILNSLKSEVLYLKFSHITDTTESQFLCMEVSPPPNSSTK